MKFRVTSTGTPVDGSTRDTDTLALGTGAPLAAFAQTCDGCTQTTTMTSRRESSTTHATYSKFRVHGGGDDDWDVGFTARQHFTSRREQTVHCFRELHGHDQVLHGISDRQDRRSTQRFGVTREVCGNTPADKLQAELDVCPCKRRLSNAAPCTRHLSTRTVATVCGSDGRERCHAIVRGRRRHNASDVMVRS